MAYIKIDFGRLDTLRNSFKEFYNKIGIAQMRVAEARENLDWQVSVRDNISRTLKEIASELNTAQTKIKNMADFLDYALHEYQNSETMTAYDIRALNAKNAAAAYAEVKNIKMWSAIDKAVSADEPGMVFLGGVRKINERPDMQFWAYTYEALSLDSSGVIKKAVKGSAKVDKIKEEAIRNSINAILASDASSESGDGVSYEEFTNAALDIAGITADSYEIFTETNTDAGSIINLVKFAYDTGVDLSEYDKMSRQQQELLLDNLEQGARKKALLEEIAAAYPEDEYLVSYCGEVIENEILRDARKKNNIIMENAGELLLDFGIGKAVGAISNGNIVTAAIKTVSLSTELIAGTNTTVETLEYIDILHTDIEACSSYYEKAAAGGNVSEEVLKFQELYMLNMKMAGVEMAKNINKTSLEQKNTKYLNDLNMLSESYQNAYAAIAAK